MLEASLV